MITLPNEIVEEIFFHLNLSDIHIFSQVNKRLHLLANNDETLRRVIYKVIAFTPEDWIFHFGFNCENDSELSIKSLPKNICKILKGPCPYFPGKKLWETHHMTWIPAGFSINRFWQLSTIPTRIVGYVEEIADQIFPYSGWILMSKTIINGSLAKDFEMQERMVCNSKCENFTVSVPSILEALISITTNIIKTGNIIFERFPIRCQESFANESQSIIYFAEDDESYPGINVSSGCTSHAVDFIGIASLLKFKNHENITEKL